MDSAEVAAYYVVAEALTNAAKYARATEVKVCVDTGGSSLHLLVRDDGIGGADATKGSGLLGLTDRVQALGGSLVIIKSPGRRHLTGGQHPVRNRVITGGRRTGCPGSAGRSAGPRPGSGSGAQAPPTR